MSEDLIIENCAPTLAGIKTGNMFNLKTVDGTDVIKETRQLNGTLGKKGIRVIPLKTTEVFSLIYIYRPEFLKKDLCNPDAVRILENKGYCHNNPESCIVQLIERLKAEDVFPHEVGLFLGYPPLDVEGFMKDTCDGVKCCGCWKAYSEPEKAMQTFRRYKECTEIYCEMHKKGKTLNELTVNVTKQV
jgi:hypothetical protein